MRTAVNRTALWSAACAAVLLALPAPAAAQDARAAGEGRWVPSFAVTGGATFQKQDSLVASECANGGPGDVVVGFAPCIFPPVDPPGSSYDPPDPPYDGSYPYNLPTDPGPDNFPVFPPPFYPPPGPVYIPPGGDTSFTQPFARASLRPLTTGTMDWAISPYVGADLQLMTPAIGPIPGRPRLFVRGEMQFLFPPARDIAKEGDPSSISLPGEITEYQNVAAITLNGQGSRTTSEFQMLVWGAGAGIAFPFQFRGRWLWVKPSVGWTRFAIDVDGLVVAGLKDDRLPDPGDPRCDPRFCPNPYPFIDDADLFGANLREVTLSGDESRTFDGVGPGLEVEMDVGHYGPIGISLFAGGSAYRVFGDRSIHFSDSVEFPDPVQPTWDGPYWSPPPEGADNPEPLSLPADTYTARWSHEVDPWLFRAMVGVRFSWLGN